VTYHIGIETGGTTCKVGILQSPVSSHNVIASEVIHTREPDATVADICAFFNKYEYTYSSMGVAAFGPICLDKKDSLYGYVTTTPKEHWGNYPLLPNLLKGIKNQAPGMKIAFDTDVNVVALFENIRTGGGKS
jgi:fructokinase